VITQQKKSAKNNEAKGFNNLMSNDEFAKKNHFSIKNRHAGRHLQKNNNVKYQSIKQFKTQTM
jgi:hypothetical protein